MALSRARQSREYGLQLFDTFALLSHLAPMLSKLSLLLPWCRPEIRDGAKADVNEQVAELDTGAQHASQLKDAIAVPKPPHDRDLVGNLLNAVGDTNAKKHGMRFGCDAVDSLPEGCVQAIVLR